MQSRYTLRFLALSARHRPTTASTGLTTAEQQVLDGLERDGIAIIHARELFGDTGPWRAVQAVAESFASSKHVQQEVEAFGRGKRRAAETKEFLVRMYPENSQVSTGDPLLQLGLHERLLNPVNAYLRFPARLQYVDVWYNIPAGDRPNRSYSQNWHRDHEDKKQVKVFLYCSDVRETAGPLQYIRGSRLGGGPYSHLWRRRSQLYPPPLELEARIPPTDVVTCSVPAGTLVFCDTTGFHRGGLATRTPRLAANWIYVTAAAFAPRRFRTPALADLAALTPRAREALG